MQAAASPFGRYVLKARIARGGMGEVFLASAVGADGFEKRVVVKRVLPSLSGSESFEQLFAAEARLMTRLEHPNIVQVFDYGRGTLGDAFLVMELVDGADLRAFHKAWRERHGAFPLGYAIFIAQQVLRGLDFAHAKSELVHRDVSPGNVLLSRLGEVKVADFGVAQVELVNGVELVGKAGYVSPEQIEGADIDLKSDLFAVGVMLYELVCDQLPFEGRDRAAPPTPPSRLRADLPASFEALILRCLALDPDERPVSAREVSRELQRLGLPIAQPDELGEAVAELFPHEMAGEQLQALGADPGEQPLTELRRGEKGLDWAPEALSLVRKTGVDTGWRTEALEDAPGPQPEGPFGGSSDFPPPQNPSDEQKPEGRVEVESPRQLNTQRSLFLGLGVSVLLLAAFGIVYSLRAPQAKPQAPEVSGSVDHASAPEVPTSSAAATSSQVPPPASASAPTPSASAAPRHAASAAAPTKQTASAVPSAAPTQDKPSCHGALQIFSNGSWSVSGGPSAVQSPGRYVWPCGRYNLSAVSRMDSTQRKGGSVQIRDGHTATLDLR